MLKSSIFRTILFLSAVFVCLFVLYPTLSFAEMRGNNYSIINDSVTGVGIYDNFRQGNVRADSSGYFNWNMANIHQVGIEHILILVTIFLVISIVLLSINFNKRRVKK